MITGFWKLSQVRRYCIFALVIAALVSSVPDWKFKREREDSGHCKSQDLTESYMTLLWSKSVTELETMRSIVNYSAQKSHSTVSNGMNLPWMIMIAADPISDNTFEI